MLVDNHAATWFSKLVVCGQLAMNFAYTLAGSASRNTVLALLEIGLILAWENAGYYGVDFLLLRRFGRRQPSMATADRGSPPVRLATQVGPSD